MRGRFSRASSGCRMFNQAFDPKKPSSNNQLGLVLEAKEIEVDLQLYSARAVGLRFHAPTSVLLGLVLVLALYLLV